MSKRIFALALMVIMLFLTGCGTEGGENNEGLKDNKNNTSSDVELQPEEVIFKGKVTSTESPGFIEMEIIDSDVAFGVYWVLINDVTEFYDIDGNPIERDDVRVKDIIEVVFSGQVMNSFPPRIAARRIYLH